MNDAIAYLAYIIAGLATLWAIPIVGYMMYSTMKMVLEDISDEITSYRAKRRARNAKR